MTQNLWAHGGYHLGALSLGICEDKYGIESARIDARTANIETSRDNLQSLTDLLTAIQAARMINKKHIDLSEHRDLIDHVKTLSPSLGKVFVEGNYEWATEDSISILTDTLTQESKRLATIINPEMMYINQGLQDLAELIKIFNKILEISGREGEHYVRNQK